MEDLTEKLILLLFGFVLTTVVGGILGYYLQNRTWRHQNNAKLKDLEREAATKIFESVSSLLDKRLYRTMQLHWKVTNGSVDIKVVEKQMNIYRQMLYDWNDNLNRNLALSQRYFGLGIRSYLEDTIYEEFKRIGGLLEDNYSTRKAGKVGAIININHDLNVLRDHIYRLNVRMITLIQQGKIGIFHPDSDKEQNVPTTPLIHLGYRGIEVEQIQIRLKELGHYGGRIDGHFGSATDKAVKSLQAASGLIPDGKVGPKTQNILNKIGS